MAAVMDQAPSAAAQPEGCAMNLTAFLLFDGNCAEAMAFYQSCLGGELTITRLGDTPMGDQAPPEQKQKVTYARLKSDSTEFSGTDWLHHTRAPRPGNTVAIYLQADDPRATEDPLRQACRRRRQRATRQPAGDAVRDLWPPS